MGAAKWKPNELSTAESLNIMTGKGNKNEGSDGEMLRSQGRWPCDAGLCWGSDVADGRKLFYFIG